MVIANTLVQFMYTTYWWRRLEIIIEGTYRYSSAQFYSNYIQSCRVRVGLIHASNSSYVHGYILLNLHAINFQDSDFKSSTCT